MNDGVAAVISGPSPEIVAGLGALAVLLFFVGLYMLVASQVLSRRLKQFVGEYQPDLAPLGDKKITDRRTVMGNLERRVTRRRGSAAIRLLLLRAGLTMTIAEYTVLRGIAGLVGFALIAFSLSSDLGVLAFVVGAVAGFFASLLPPMYIRMKASRRVAAFEKQLPEALDMMGAALQAGAGLGQAVELISREMAPPISQEFQRVMQEVSLGLSLYEALVNLSERVGSEDLELAVTTIGVQFRVGGNLVQILKVITNTIRERVRIKGEIKVLTAQQRMSAWVISLVPPALALALFILNPGYEMRLLDPGITRCMLGGSIVMVLAGIYALQKITQIEI
jgi:tight adherence protein B